MYYNHLKRSKLANLSERNWYLIYDNHEVNIFCLLNYISTLISKLHGNMKQKLAPLWSRFNNKVFVVPYHISWQRIAICCVVTVDYVHFSRCHNSRTVLSNQNVCTNPLNIVLTNSKLLQGNGRNHALSLQINCT